MESGKLARICLVTSQGGHMDQMHLLRECYENHPHFMITVRNKEEIRTCDNFTKCYYVTNVCEGRWKNPLRLLKMVREVYKILRHEKPQFIISTGGGISAPTIVVAKLMKIKIIYVEAGARVYTLSKTGRICYCLSDLFFVQHLQLACKYPKAIYRGILYKHFGGGQ